MLAASGIYEIKCLPTGRRYVGQSLSMKGRLRDHQIKLERGKHSNSRLQRAWNKYGSDAFAFSPLLVCGRDDLTFYEQLVADGYRSSTGVFNISEIVNSPNKGCKFTSRTRKRMQDARARTLADPEKRENNAAAVRAATKTLEYRENMSRVVQARWDTPGYREKIEQSGFRERVGAAVRKGSASKESRARRAASAKAAWDRDPERSAVQSQTTRRTLATTEHSERIRRNNAKMWSDPQHRARITAKSAERNSDPEFQRKFVAAIKRGWENNGERRAKLSAAISKARNDPERAAAWNAALRAAKNTPEYRAKVTGQKRSAETKAKMAEARRRYWAKRKSGAGDSRSARPATPAVTSNFDESHETLG